MWTVNEIFLTCEERSVSKTKKRSFLLARQEPVWTWQGRHTPSLYHLLYHVSGGNIKTRLLTAHVRGRPRFKTLLLCSITGWQEEKHMHELHKLQHICVHILQVCLGMPLTFTSVRNRYKQMRDTQKYVSTVYRFWQMFNISGSVQDRKNSYQRHQPISCHETHGARWTVRETAIASVKSKRNRGAAKGVAASGRLQTPRRQWPPGSFFSAVPKNKLPFDGDVGNLLQQNQTSAEQPDPPTPPWTHQSAQTGNILLFQRDGKIRSMNVSNRGTHVKTWFDEVILFTWLPLTPTQHPLAATCKDSTELSILQVDNRRVWVEERWSRYEVAVMIN